MAGWDDEDDPIVEEGHSLKIPVFEAAAGNPYRQGTAEEPVQHRFAAHDLHTWMHCRVFMLKVCKQDREKIFAGGGRTANQKFATNLVVHIL